MITAQDLNKLSSLEKDGLILGLSASLDMALKQIAQLQARIGDFTRPGKTPDNSSLPPSKGQKPTHPDKPKHQGPRTVSWDVQVQAGP